MPEPFSIALAVCVGYSAVAGLARNDSSESSEGKILSSKLDEIASSVESSESLFGAKLSTIAEIHKIVSESSSDEVDLAVANCAALNAEYFVRSIPTEFALPEVGLDPEGEIAFDWVFGKFRRLSLAVGNSDRISYAWLNGKEKGHGVAVFTRDRIPDALRQQLQLLGNYDSEPSIRFAF